MTATSPGRPLLNVCGTPGWSKSADFPLCPGLRLHLIILPPAGLMSDLGAKPLRKQKICEKSVRNVNEFRIFILFFFKAQCMENWRSLVSRGIVLRVFNIHNKWTPMVRFQLVNRVLLWLFRSWRKQKSSKRWKFRQPLCGPGIHRPVSVWSLPLRMARFASGLLCSPLRHSRCTSTT